jgi:hypothetical protein
VNGALVSKPVLDKHIDTIKTITKFYTDKSKDNEYFTECAPYAPILAWAT